MSNKFAEFIKQVINSPIVLPLGISLGLTLACMILVIYLFLFGLINLFISLGYSNPLNEEYMPYKFSQDSFFIRTPYFYGIVFLIIIVAWLVSIWGLVLMKRKEGVSGQDKFLMVTLFVYTLWLSLLSFAVLAGVREKIKQVSNSIHEFNNFVYNNIYLNSRFLANVREPVKNGLLLKTKIEEAITAYCNDKLNVKNIETASQVLFTVNYYYNLHKLGLDNPLLSDATQMLSPAKLLVVLSKAVKDTPASFSPANYIYTNGIFMDDFSNIWWDTISRKCIDEIVTGTAKDPSLSAKLNQTVNRNTVRLYVLTKTTSQMSQLNNYANSIRTKDALGAFFLLSLLFIGVYWLPVVVLWLLNPEKRESFFNFLGNLFGVEVPQTPIGTQQAGEEVILNDIAEKGRKIKELVGQSGGGETPYQQGMRLLCEAQVNVIKLHNLENPDQKIPEDGPCTTDVFKSKDDSEQVQNLTSVPTEGQVQNLTSVPTEGQVQNLTSVSTERQVQNLTSVSTEGQVQNLTSVPTENHHSIIENLIETVAKPLINNFLNSDEGKELLQKLNSVAEDGKDEVKRMIHQELNKRVLSVPQIAPYALLIVGPIKNTLDSIIDSAINFAITQVNQEIEGLKQGGKGRRTYQRKQNRSRN